MDGKQVSNQTLATELAQALMLEQVKFIKKQLIENKNNDYIEKFIHQIFLQSDQIKLNDVILLDQLNAVVSKYAFDLNLGPDLLEFIGFAAQKVHHFIVTSDSRIDELLTDETFDLWMNKVLELEQVRHYIQQNITLSPKAQRISLQLANQILESNTPWLDHLRKLSIKRQGLSAKLLNYVQDQQQYIELQLEKQLAQVILKQLGHIITLPTEELAEMSLDIWSEVKTKTFKEAFSQINAIDLEDFFILVYESWKAFRQTPQLQKIILSVLKAFYDYFGDYSLQELLLAVGVDEVDLHEEAKRFLPSTIQALDAKHLLNPIIQALIEPFYFAQDTQHILQHYLNQSTSDSR